MTVYDYKIVDAYSLTHVWWGTLYGYVFSPITIESLSWEWGFCVAMAIAVLWEVFENNKSVIEKWWKPIGFKYSQDSWLNMIGDCLSSSAGYVTVYAFEDSYETVLIISSCVGVLTLFYCHFVRPQHKATQLKLQDYFDDPEGDGRCGCDFRV